MIEVELIRLIAVLCSVVTVLAGALVRLVQRLQSALDRMRNDIHHLKERMSTVERLLTRIAEPRVAEKVGA